MGMSDTTRKYKEQIRTKIDDSPKPKTGFKPNMSPYVSWRDRIRNRFRLRVQDGDTITWRKHVVALIRQAWIQSLGMFALLPLTILSVFGIIPGREIVAPVLFFLFAIFSLAFLVQLIDWSNDIYMLTKDRVVDIERNAIGVLVKPSVEAPFSAVQNVSFTQPNPLFLLLNVGDVIIQTAGATGQMVFYWMSNPSQVANEVLTRVDEARRKARQAELEQLRTDVLHYVDAYNNYLEDEDRLRGAPPRPSDFSPTPGSDDSPPAQ
jgi:membrane protein YdbS with pleckstrin-like domain